MGESDRKLPVNDYSNTQENLRPALVKNHCTQTFNTLMFTFVRAWDSCMFQIYGVGRGHSGPRERVK